MDLLVFLDHGSSVVCPCAKRASARPADALCAVHPDTAPPRASLVRDDDDDDDEAVDRDEDRFRAALRAAFASALPAPRRFRTWSSSALRDLKNQSNLNCHAWRIAMRIRSQLP